MKEETNNYHITRVFLFIIATAVTILGALFIYNMLVGIDATYQYMNNVLNLDSNQSSYSNYNGSLNLVRYIKFYIWISLFYVIVFWLSLISLPVTLSNILGKNRYLVNDILLRVLGLIILLFGGIIFVFYLTYSDNLNNIEWIRNFRLGIGSLFLLFNGFHGIICISVANIHQSYLSVDEIVHHFNFGLNKKA